MRGSGFIQICTHLMVAGMARISSGPLNWISRVPKCCVKPTLFFSRKDLQKREKIPSGNESEIIKSLFRNYARILKRGIGADRGTNQLNRLPNRNNQGKLRVLTEREILFSDVIWFRSHKLISGKTGTESLDVSIILKILQPARVFFSSLAELVSGIVF